MQREILLSYLAGLFDGEGSFSIQVVIRKYKDRPSVWFWPRLSAHMKNSRPLLELYATEFGGKVYSSDVTKRPGMDIWVLTKRDALEQAINALLPYLKLKAPIAKRFLEALSYFPRQRKRHRNGERSWERQAALAVAEIAFSLNPEGARKSKKDASYLEKIAAVYDEAGALKGLPAAKPGPPKGTRKIKGPDGKWHFDKNAPPKEPKPKHIFNNEQASEQFLDVPKTPGVTLVKNKSGKYFRARVAKQQRFPFTPNGYEAAVAQGERVKELLSEPNGRAKATYSVFEAKDKNGHRYYNLDASTNRFLPYTLQGRQRATDIVNTLKQRITAL